MVRKSDVVHQLLFNVDICCTLQEVHSKLQVKESQRTLAYLANMYNLTPRPYMTMIEAHYYVVGQCKVTEATSEQADVLSHTGNIEIFYRLMKHCTMYYSRVYGKVGKRDNTYCLFEIDGLNCFGQIDCFVYRPFPCALVRKLQLMADPSRPSVPTKSSPLPRK